MDAQETRIYARRMTENDYEEELVGLVDAYGVVYRVNPNIGVGRQYPIGRVDDERRVFRTTKYSDREVGSYTVEGHIRSHGLFEGGELGWIDHRSVVTQGGLILGENEVGFIEGPDPHAGAAALLLLILPDEAEASKQAGR